jgi:hypothetical protein
MYKATVIEVFIASPSDIIQERNCFKEIIEEWNIIHSRSRNAILKFIGWENDVYSLLNGQEPQAVINNQILKDSDLLVGIFWTRIGTPTKDYDSGTIEEIQKHMKQGKPVMLFFLYFSVVPSSINNEQYEKLLQFKEWCKRNGVINSFNSTDDFIKQFRNQLGIIMNNDKYILELIGKENFSELSSVSYRENTIPLSDNALQLLKEISLDRGGQLTAIMTLGGYYVQTNGKSFGTGRYDAREVAQINGAIEELEKYDLIRATNPKRELFNITANGYNIIDNIST